MIYFTLLVFVIFGGLDFYIAETKHQQAEHLMQYYLDRIRIEGFLSTADETKMINDFKDIGLTVTAIDAPRESQGDGRVLRNNDDVNASEVHLQVTCTFTDVPFIFGSLIGYSAPSGIQVKVGGRGISEYVGSNS